MLYLKTQKQTNYRIIIEQYEKSLFDKVIKKLQTYGSNRIVLRFKFLTNLLSKIWYDNKLLARAIDSYTDKNISKLENWELKITQITLNNLFINILDRY